MEHSVQTETAATSSFNIFGELVTVNPTTHSMSDLPSAAAMAAATMQVLKSKRDRLSIDLMDLIDSGTIGRREVLWLATIGLMRVMDDMTNDINGGKV